MRLQIKLLLNNQYQLIMNSFFKTPLLLIFSFGSYISFSQTIGAGYEAQITNFTLPLLSGAYQGDNGPGAVSGGLQSLDGSHQWNHLFTIRHNNTANNHQLQIASTYAENDDCFLENLLKLEQRLLRRSGLN